MKKFVSSILHLIQSMQSISSMQIKEEFKKNIRKTYLWSIFLGRFDAKSRIIKIAGYDFKCCTYWSFWWLFRQIFLEQAYFFTTGGKNPLIIDCGSNIGMSILFFKLIYPDSEIIAFEPDEDAFVCLKENVETCNFSFVSLNKKALSKFGGTIDFYYDEHNPGCLIASTVKERLPKSERKVDSVKLSAYIEREVDFLKMDIEGAELSVIEELSDSGKLNRVKQMAIEYHHHIIGREDMLSRMLHILEAAGFGYQVESRISRPFRRSEFQDVFIYAYRKDDGILLD